MRPYEPLCRGNRNDPPRSGAGLTPIGHMYEMPPSWVVPCRADLPAGPRERQHRGMSVVSLSATSGRDDLAAALVAEVGERLATAPRRGTDGTWELGFPSSYTVAHAAVVEALNALDPRWPARVTVEYALTI